MDVRCEKCQTVYELEDARVKDGGVTVKCTRCGHIFKVARRQTASRPVPRTLSGMAPVPTGPSTPGRAPSGSATTGDEARLWLLRSAATGGISRFRDLTTLQQWIVESKAVRDDEISRTGDRWKRIGGIAELEPFFRIVEQAHVGGPPASAAATPLAAMTSTRATATAPEVAAAGPEADAPHIGAMDLAPEPAFTTDPSSEPPLHRRSATDSGPRTLGSGAFAAIDDDEFDEMLPRRRPRARTLAVALSSLALLGAGGYVTVYQRPALQRMFHDEDGWRDAYRKGREYFLLDGDEDFSRADRELQRAQAADAANPKPLAALMELRVTWARHLLDDAKRAAPAQPQRAAALRRNAESHLDEAKRYAGDARSMGESDPDLNRALADLLVLEGAPTTEVEARLTAAEARQPDDPETRYVRGELLLRDGKTVEAQAAFEQANQLEQQQTSHDLLRADYQLALLALANEQRDAARAAAERILAVNPHHLRAAALIDQLAAPAPAPANAADAAPAAHPVAGAPAALADTSAPAPGAPAPNPAPAVAAPALATGAPEPAKPKPRDYASLVAEGDRLLQRGRSRDSRAAAALFEAALAQQPDGIEALNGLGWASLDSERYGSAVDRFHQTLRIMPNNGDALIGLAETYKMRGDKARALDYYKKYLEVLPDGSKAALARTNVEELRREVSKLAAPANAPSASAPSPTENRPKVIIVPAN